MSELGAATEPRGAAKLSKRSQPVLDTTELGDGMRAAMGRAIQLAGEAALALRPE